MDVLVGDVVGGEGAAVVVGRVEGLPRHPTLQSLSCHGPLYCVFGNRPFVLIIFYSISWWAAHPLRAFEFVVANWLQRAGTASLKAGLGKAELYLSAAFWRRSGGGGAVWREAGRWLV